MELAETEWRTDRGNSPFITSRFQLFKIFSYHVAQIIRRFPRVACTVSPAPSPPASKCASVLPAFLPLVIGDWLYTMISNERINWIVSIAMIYILVRKKIEKRPRKTMTSVDDLLVTLITRGGIRSR